MNILYNIRHKGRITILAIVVFFLVAFSSYTYNKSISEMGDISSEMYSDRLIAQDYIYQLGKILYERKLIMASQTATNTADTFKYDSTGILTLLNNYEKTKLTKNEKIQFQEFRKNVLLLLSFEQKQLLNSNKGLNSNILALQSNAVNVSLVQLDKLAEIQIATGKQLNDDSTKIVSFSSLLNQFDWAIIIVIGLIIQVIIFTTKSAIPKKSSKSIFELILCAINYLSIYHKNISLKNRNMKPLQIKNILIPTDFSQTGLLAVEHAVFMARLCKANLFLFHAIELSKTTFGIYDAVIEMPDFSDIKKIANNKLTELANMLRKKHGITVKTICIKGKVAYEVVNAVKENKIDIVVMGTHGASGFNEYFIGSNAHKIVTVCPCPVITVQTNAKKLGFSNIVLPIDNKFNSRQKVNAAISLAKKYAAKIHVLGLLDKDGGVNPNKFKVKLDSVEKAIQKAKVTYQIKTKKADNLSLASIKYSKKVKADLIVVLSDEESHLSGLLFGAFAKQIVNHSKIPVMSIPPLDLGVYEFKSLPGFH